MFIHGFAFKAEGVTTGGRADEVGITLRMHQSDQEHFGWSKPHSSSNHLLCVVTVMNNMAGVFQERFRGGVEEHLPPATTTLNMAVADSSQAITPSVTGCGSTQTLVQECKNLLCFMIASTVYD